MPPIVLGVDDVTGTGMVGVRGSWDRNRNEPEKQDQDGMPFPLAVYQANRNRGNVIRGSSCNFGMGGLRSA
jgi:hypothetical protein